MMNLKYSSTISKSLGLIAVSIFSSCNNKVDQQQNYFLNKDFKNLVDEIVRIDSTSDNISILLTDDKPESLLTIYSLGHIEDCEDVKTIFKYKNKIISLVDYSDKYSFDLLVNLSKIEEYSDCASYIKTLDDNVFRDYKSYPYIYKNNKLFYLNNLPIEYNNEKVELNKITIDTINW